MSILKMPIIGLYYDRFKYVQVLYVFLQNKCLEESILTVLSYVKIIDLKSRINSGHLCLTA